MILQGTKRVIVLLVAVMMLSNTCLAVGETDRYEAAVEYLSGGIEEESGNITRSECILYIMRLIGMSEEDAYNNVYNTAYAVLPFSEFGHDINDGYIVSAYDYDVTQGVYKSSESADLNIFAPEREVTLKECLTFMLRCLTEPELVEWENTVQDSVEFGLIYEDELGIYDENRSIDRGFFYTLLCRILDKDRYFYWGHYAVGGYLTRKVDEDKSMRYIDWVEEIMSTENND